jgi:hypothetical protein
MVGLCPSCQRIMTASIKSPNEMAEIESDRKSEVYHKYYDVETKNKNPRHWATLQLENADVRIEPSRLVVNAWGERDVFFLRGPITFNRRAVA